MIKGVYRKPTAKSYLMVRDWLLSLKIRSRPGCPHMPLPVASVLKAMRQDKDRERPRTGEKGTRPSLLADLGDRES